MPRRFLQDLGLCLEPATVPVQDCRGAVGVGGAKCAACLRSRRARALAGRVPNVVIRVVEEGARARRRGGRRSLSHGTQHDVRDVANDGDS